MLSILVQSYWILKEGEVLWCPVHFSSPSLLKSSLSWTLSPKDITNIPVIRNKGDSESGVRTMTTCVNVCVYLLTHVHTFTRAHAHPFIHSLIQEWSLRCLLHVSDWAMAKEDEKNKT